jgi:hypothetical protein
MQNDGHVPPVTSLQVAQPRLVLTAPPLPSCLSRVGQCGFHCHKYALYYKKWNSACAVRRDAWARKSDKLPACKILCCASRVMTMDKSGARQRAIVFTSHHMFVREYVEISQAIYILGRD